MFIMLDGIDGSGKSTVIKTWKEELERNGKRIFDLKNYWEKKKKYPLLEELSNFEFIFSCEPTHAGIGKVIREELINKNNKHPARAISEAYSLDRLVLYTRLLIPLLKQSKHIIQDRGVSSSLAYQPILDKKLNIKFHLSLPGNQLAMLYRPDYLVLLEADPGLAMKRLGARTSKKDNAIFEKINFQKKLARLYRSAAFKKIFASRGTRVLYLPANDKIDIMNEMAIKLLNSLDFV
jgi:dTMP kinase